MIDISVSGLVKEFEVGKKILDGLTFQVDAGERVGLLGPNGCGKTTFLRILTGEVHPDEGDIVVALFEDEATVKTLHRDNGHIWLLPENPEYQPIDGEGAALLGRVVAVIRRY